MKLPRLVNGKINGKINAHDNDALTETLLHYACVSLMEMVTAGELTARRKSCFNTTCAPCSYCVMANLIGDASKRGITGTASERQWATLMLEEAAQEAVEMAAEKCLSPQAQLEWLWRGRAPTYEDIWPDGSVIANGLVIFDKDTT